MNNGGVMTISRPQSDAGKVFSKYPANQVPLNAQLVVGNNEACLFLKDGSVVGILPPGQYVLNAEAFPVLQQLIVTGPKGHMIACEIFFIFGQTLAGNRFGGKLTLPMKPGATGASFVRGTYDYHVIDPGKLIQTIAGIGGDWSSIADQFPPPHVKAKVFAAVQNQIAALVGRQGGGNAPSDLPAAISTPEVQQALGADIQGTAQEIGIELLAVRVDAVEQKAEMQPPAPEAPPVQPQGMPGNQGMVGAPQRMAPGQMGQWLKPGARVLGCYEGEWYEATVSQAQPDGVYLNWDDGTASMVSMEELRPSTMPGPSDIGPGARVMAKYEEVFYECAIAFLDSGGATINWDDGTQSYVALHDIRLLF